MTKRTVGKPRGVLRSRPVEGRVVHERHARARWISGREALLEYVLRPPIAEERVTQGPDGLVRIAL